MFGRAHRASFVALVTLALLAGCGSTGIFAKSASHRRRRTSTPVTSGPTVTSPPTTVPLAPGLGGDTVPTPGPTGIRPPTADVNVIRAWSDALRRGDVQAAAHYFALPSVMINGTDVSGEALMITIDTRAEAQAANASLPCGARFISADQRGRYVNALFRLTGRPGPGGSNCGSGSGQTARTNFVIAHGLIQEWIRAPDDPGDNGSSPAPITPPAPAGSSPSV